MTAPEPKGIVQALLWQRRKATFAFLLILLAAVHVSAAETAPETADREIFAVRAGSYPVRRWADQAASQYLRQEGVYAFVDASPKTEDNCRYLLYLGKFESETDARDLAQTLAGDQRISPAWEVEAVSPTLCRKRLAVCNGEKEVEKKPLSARTDNPGNLRLQSSQLAQPSNPIKGKLRAPDHHRLIRSILGGLNDPKNDRIIELETSVASGTNQTASMAPSSPIDATDFDLVPFTD
ncbi:MAG: SPOR domain-containing protein [Desulfobacterales bacterium]|nr:SPOR domain-containing protein [Desulfobacterales bacterium]